MVFVDWVISQVHEKLFEVIFGRLLVLLSAESGQAFIANVSLDGVCAHNDHVYSQIKFEAIN